jgi:hypothetical protein
MERIGRADNFFELGGHSLFVIQAIARIQLKWPIEVSIGSLFEHPTLSEFAAHVDELRSSMLLKKLAAGETEIEELLAMLGPTPVGAACELQQESDMEKRP